MRTVEPIPPRCPKLFEDGSRVKISWISKCYADMDNQVGPEYVTDLRCPKFLSVNKESSRPRPKSGVSTRLIQGALRLRPVFALMTLGTT